MIWESNKLPIDPDKLRKQLHIVLSESVSQLGFTPAVSRRGIPEKRFIHCTNVGSRTLAFGVKNERLTTRLPITLFFFNQKPSVSNG